MFSFRLAVIPAVLMCAVACGNNSSTTSPSPTPSPVPAPGGGGPSTPVSIPMGAEVLGNRAFSPDTLNVAAGTTVMWTNNDAVSHTTTSNTNAWNSGIVAPGGTYSFTFQTAGSYQYHCAIHPGMVGTVVVQ